MAGPLGVLSAFPAATAIKVEEDVYGRALGGVIGIPEGATTEYVEDIDGRPPGGAVGIFNSGHHRS
jgi:hypothetical protein